MDSKLKVIFVSPCYNAEKNIEKLIDSIRSQNDSRWHHVIIDDISTDNTYEVAQKYTQDDSRFTVIRNSEKKYALRNIIEASRDFSSKQNIIATVDGDDSLCNNDAVSKLIKDIHCNPKVPENHNLRKRNKKDKFIEYFDGNEWKVEDKKKQLDHLVDMTFTILENIVDMEDDIESKHLERFSIFRDKYYENRDNIKTNNINDAEIMIMNNSN